jgi:hypothetical protein
MHQQIMETKEREKLQLYDHHPLIFERPAEINLTTSPTYKLMTTASNKAKTKKKRVFFFFQINHVKSRDR